ncbi:MAG: hypothetical protein RLZZ338_3701 [Cyanobacteriota bacterium]|jgi:hypothetical protein
MSIFDFWKPRSPKPSTVYHRDNISDDIQITVEGLPENLEPDERKKIITSLVRNTLPHLKECEAPPGETIYQGQASLRIEDKIYQIKYSLDFVRVLTALEVYKQAFDAVNIGAYEGTYDPDLAELTANYIKQEAWHEAHPQEKRKSHKPDQNSDYIDVDKITEDKQ